ncbi:MULTISPECIES: hypothetical protein [Streptomyces]|uniref:hypothetical protein n=1 Tax=Streptomyces TaxID=1883 RepID=UPI00167AE80D|nr:MULTISPECIES: hypothetical protein [Streptomyces]MBD3575194.1 hypothetical protein [Streptomyces sp. KD18]GGT16003.1 hypothetical protein GCM10010286_46970 [Streptomyces toxytricini]
MKQKITLLAGAVAVAGGVVLAAAATGQASPAERGQSVTNPAPRATVAFGHELSVSDPGAVEPLGEWGVGRRTPRA